MGSNPAPVIDACKAGLRQVIADPEDHAGRGPASRAWIGGYHSAERILALQCAAYERLLDEDGVLAGSRAAISSPARPIAPFSMRAS